MDPLNIAAVLVAAIGAAGAWAAQRAAARATITNTVTSGRVDMEKEAYDRARGFDTETIKRQDQEIEELREDNRRLHEDNGALHEEIRALRKRIARLELGLKESLEDILHERLKE